MLTLSEAFARNLGEGRGILWSVRIKNGVSKCCVGSYFLDNFSDSTGRVNHDPVYIFVTLMHGA